MNHKSRRRGSSVASTLDAVRENDGPGDRQCILYQCTDVRSAIIVLLQYFYLDQPASEVWKLTAKSVRPREKSFITVISRFQYPAHKKNMNDVRGQKMSENTLLSFSIFAKFSFLRFAENVWGGCQAKSRFIKCALTRRSYTEMGYSNKRPHHPHFWENPLF